jgi:hypothetical protein
MLATPWKCGWQVIKEKYGWAIPILYHISTIPNTTIIAPFGTTLITQHLVEDNDTDGRNLEESQSLSHIEAFSDSDLLKDDGCTMGMQELEDTAADAQWPNTLGDRQNDFTNVVQIGKHIMNKSYTIVQHFCYAKSVSSMDRLCCIA